MTSPLWPALLSEAQFTDTVVAMAHWHGWLVAHFRPARRADGSWATPVLADGAGFPDLVLVRGDRVLFVELKSERGKLAPLQERWMDALTACPGVEAYEWRPSQLDAIAELLA